MQDILVAAISAAKLINIVIQFMLDYKDDEKHMMIVK